MFSIAEHQYFLNWRLPTEFSSETTSVALQVLVSLFVAEPDEPTRVRDESGLDERLFIKHWIRFQLGGTSPSIRTSRINRPPRCRKGSGCGQATTATGKSSVAAVRCLFVGRVLGRINCPGGTTSSSRVRSIGSVRRLRGTDTTRRMDCR
ncbi:MAG: hypothetical protein CBC35_05040 [Planctomycetes bacterium TMED75]|nr:hypothetical protein [Planctomycetaceae bacterium]OUU93692.1 MAG: hypothetical protein CBC35_05040 [Planctomycetes bacterium TMED75]